MTTPATDAKMLVDALYHSAVVSGLAAEMPGLARWRLGVAPPPPPPPPPPKLDFTPRDVVDVALAMATKDMLIKQGLIPADILKYSNACWWRHGERHGVLGVGLPVLHVEKL